MRESSRTDDEEDRSKGEGEGGTYTGDNKAKFIQIQAVDPPACNADGDDREDDLEYAGHQHPGRCRYDFIAMFPGSDVHYVGFGCYGMGLWYT